MFIIKKNFHRAIHNFQLGSRLPLHWWNKQNWGDALNPIITEFLSERAVKFTKIKYCDGFLAIGSVLSLANSHTTVWGSGFMSKDEVCKEIPRKVHAVRGPLTRDMLLEQGVDCPEVYGDPALLLPLFYNRNVMKKYRLGVIPHYTDEEHSWVKEIEKRPDVRIINTKSSIFDFVDEVKSCEFIVSSSLHGLICADSYGIPNVHIELSANVVGDNFKFEDYAKSVGNNAYLRLNANIDTHSSAVINEIQVASINCDLKSLLLNCPFLSNNLRRKVDMLTTGRLELASIRNAVDSAFILNKANPDVI